MLSNTIAKVSVFYQEIGTKVFLVPTDEEYFYNFAIKTYGW